MLVPPLRSQRNSDPKQAHYGFNRGKTKLISVFVERNVPNFDLLRPYNSISLVTETTAYLIC